MLKIVEVTVLGIGVPAFGAATFHGIVDVTALRATLFSEEGLHGQKCTTGEKNNAKKRYTHLRPCALGAIISLCQTSDT